MISRSLKKKLAKIDANWRNCRDVRCPLPHPNDASDANLGPPGIVKPKMCRTRPVRKAKP